MNPDKKSIIHQTVTKIANGVTFLDILKLEGGKDYYWTHRNYGEDAPDLPENLNNPRIPTTSEWVIMPNYITTFKSNSLSDIYIYCTGATSERDGVLLTGEFTDYDMSTASGTSEPFELAVSKGMVPGHSLIDKFGENPDVDVSTAPEDICEQGGVYPYDAVGTAPIVSLVSDSALDTMDILVTGQDINRNEISQLITLTGTTKVALTTPLWRVYRMYNEGLEGNDVNGTIYCYTGLTNTPLSSEIRAIIENGNNQTLMALYTIPLGKVGYLYRGEFGVSRNKDGDARLSYYSRRLGKVFRVKKRVTTVTNGSSNYSDKRSFPDVIPSGTDIKLRVETVSKDDIGIFGTFDIMLVDEDLLSTEYLTKIGQPGY